MMTTNNISCSSLRPVELATLADLYEFMRKRVAIATEHEERTLRKVEQQAAWSAFWGALVLHDFRKDELAPLIGFYLVLHQVVAAATMDKQEGLRQRLQACQKALWIALEQHDFTLDDLDTLTSCYQVLCLEYRQAQDSAIAQKKQACWSALETILAKQSTSSVVSVQLLQLAQILYLETIQTDSSQQAVLWQRQHICWAALISILEQFDFTQEGLPSLIQWSLAIQRGVMHGILPLAAGHRYQQACTTAVITILEHYDFMKDRLPDLVQLYQVICRSFERVTSREQTQILHQSQNDCSQAIWLALADHLIIIAAKWLHSSMGQNLLTNPSYPTPTTVVSALAQQAFGDIIESLRTMDVDPYRNLYAYLRHKAYWSLHEDNQTIYGHTSKSAHTDLSASYTSTAMWPKADRPITVTHDEFENQVLTRLSVEEVLAAAWVFVEKLQDPDLTIVRRRWKEDPPASYETIAADLGGQWSASNLRVRYHRILNRILKYLQLQPSMTNLE